MAFVQKKFNPVLTISLNCMLPQYHLYIMKLRLLIFLSIYYLDSIIPGDSDCASSRIQTIIRPEQL